MLAQDRTAQLSPRTLLIALASKAGTDDYGNTFPQGIYVTEGLIEGPTIIAGAVIAVAGCALGVLLAMIFLLLHHGVPLSYVLGHLGGPGGLFHYYPSQVGVLGLLFWAVAAIRIPLQGQRLAAAQPPVTPVWGQTPTSGPQAGDLPPESAQPMFVQPAEPKPTAEGSGPSPAP